ncbi:Nop14-like protein [Lactarius pseudohatsudake]|nr:Nop14-like protein [Lactarius pseudohatsudake]
MGKGSQLSQLKSALSQTGLSRQSRPGRKRRRVQNEEKETVKRAARLRDIQQKLNPFDVKVTKLKHDVGGRKLKGVSGKPAQSKQAGIDLRKKTLLKEFEEKGRAGGIIDRRFGENDPTLTPEERMLERFTRERQRASNGTFNLEDDADLTHYGQSLSKLDDFDDVGLRLDSDEEDAKGQIDGDIVKGSHFGGFGSGSEDESETEHPKSRAEVMAEVIAKSKEHKALRRKQQEESNDIRHQLDRELDTIRNLLSGPDPVSGSVEKDVGPKAFGASREDHDQQYDQFVRELVFDQRSKPKDRTKTEEELALEAKIALEKAERQRIRRMNGEDDDENSEGEKPRKRRRPTGGDDLEDDFSDVDDLGGLGVGLRSDLDGTGEDSNSEHGSDDGSGTSEDGTSEEHGPAPRSGLPSVTDPATSGSEKRARGGTTSSDELPYTFPCPSSHEDFLDIADGLSDQDSLIVIERMRTLHHPSLSPENPSKLQAFGGVLVDHILHVASPPSPRLALISDLLPHLRTLTKMYPRQIADHFIGKLVLMHKNLKRGLTRGAKTWPGLPELALLRILGALWPTSDMHHIVVSPARLLMGSYLGLCKIRSLADAASGLFLCTLFLQYESLSKRFVPEVINFLIGVVQSLSPRRGASNESGKSTFSSSSHNKRLCVIDKGEAAKLTANRPDLVTVIGDEQISTQVNVDLLSLAADLLVRFSELYKALDGFVELYSPVLEVLSDANSDVLCPTLQDQIAQTITTVQKLLKFSLQARQPLRLQAHKPIPIPTFMPKFESHSSSYLRTRDPDHERQEAAKLRKQHKEERKGAIRELRKDARFLATVEQERQREKDKSYHQRMKKVFGGIEVERAEEKAMERKKAREKRRAGRK